MLANMASSLILHKRINTTVAKAKALRTYIEPLITKAKEDTTHSRRVVFSYLSDKAAVTELFREVAQKIGDRPGGYTRILKTGTRLGDSAEMCLIELVDFNEKMLAAKTDAKGKPARRSRRAPKKKGEETPAASEKKPAVKAAAKPKPVKAVKKEETTPAAEPEDQQTDEQLPEESAEEKE